MFSCYQKIADFCLLMSAHFHMLESLVCMESHKTLSDLWVLINCLILCENCMSAYLKILTVVYLLPIAVGDSTLCGPQATFTVSVLSNTSISIWWTGDVGVFKNQTIGLFVFEGHTAEVCHLKLLQGELLIFLERWPIQGHIKLTASLQETEKNSACTRFGKLDGWLLTTMLPFTRQCNFTLKICQYSFWHIYI